MCHSVFRSCVQWFNNKLFFLSMLVTHQTSESRGHRWLSPLSSDTREEWNFWLATSSGLRAEEGGLWASGFWVWLSGFWVLLSGFWVWLSGFWVWLSGFWVSPLCDVFPFWRLWGETFSCFFSCSTLEIWSVDFFPCWASERAWFWSPLSPTVVSPGTSSPDENAFHQLNFELQIY